MIRKNIISICWSHTKDNKDTSENILYNYKLNYSLYLIRQINNIKFLFRNDPDAIQKIAKIERRYSCRAMLKFEPVAPPAIGGISQINKSSLVVHMWSCTCVRKGWNESPILVLYVTWSCTLLLINTLIVHTLYQRKQSSETVNKSLSDFTAQSLN